MRPLDSAGAAEVPEPGLRPDDAPRGAAEEPAAAEAAGTPGRGRCGLCGSSPCGWCAPPEAKKKAPCPGLGLFYTLLSAFLFSVGSLFVKKVQDVHAVEISAFRCVFQMLVVIPCLIYRKSGFIGPKGQRIFLVLRGVLGSTAMILLYYAFQATSLADATVITFSTPVFTSIFAWIFLKEKYSPWDALFTVFTITGVTLIVRPPFLFGASAASGDRSYSAHLKGTFAAVAHAVFAALTLVILRRMGKSVDYFLSIWYYVVLGLLESVVVLFILGEWSLPHCGLDRLFLILIGLFGLGGQVFLTKAIQIEKAGPVAIMKTMDVVFAFILQIIFFNDVPTWWTVGGALCVIASSVGAAIRKWCQSAP
ncbi:solute carrier family 35 member G1 [Vulpes lagopus]|uniref:solute carrier family 35 member G1 n=1 Tax=Vulpes lagopus TaxID=494514 RepID=UPI001BC8E178|nr:solute carrier family 35 member G1 [Vulpes lagopus]XP_041601154.1 solute carrier family 35 member G1 [Vulpes lagopus]